MRYAINRTNLGLFTAGSAAAMTSLAFAVNPAVQALRTHVGSQAKGLLGESVAPLGDINNDGIPDYIIGAPGLGTSTTLGVTVRSGATGGVLFQFPGEDGKCAFGWSISDAGDVNNDGVDDILIGDPEMIVGCMDQGGALVYSGLDGSLLMFELGLTGFEKFGYAVAGIGDVNGDGYDDIAVGAPRRSSAFGGNAGSVTVFSGLSGEILYQTTTVLNSKLGSDIVALGDVNGDGFPDMAATAPLRGKVFIYDVHNGHTIRVITGSISAGFATSIANAGDLNGDGVNELAVGAPFSGVPWMAGRVYVYDGSSGTLLRTLRGEAAGDGTGTSISGAGDVNGDGIADLVVGAPWASSNGSGTGKVLVYSGQSGQVIRAFVSNSPYCGYGAAVAGIGDLNGDGLDDLLIGAPKAGNQKGATSIYPGGTNQLGLGDPTNITTDSPDFVAAGDLNGDNIADAVSVSTATDTIAIHLSIGNGNFAPAVLYPAGSAPASVAIGDFDHNGTNDLAVASSNTKTIILFKNNGNGSMVAKGTLKTAKKPGAVIAADLNGDGHVDLAVANQNSDTVSVFLNYGYSLAIQKCFKPASIYAVGDNPGQMLAADLNGDTYPDLVVASQNSGQLSVLRNKMNGKFFGQELIPTIGTPTRIAIADFDANDTKDIACLSSLGLTILVNNGNASFQPGAQVAVNEATTSLAAIDMDYDGYPDLATSNPSGVITLRLNTQNGQFGNALTFGATAGAQWMATADIDGDGDQDIITANSSVNSLSTLINQWFH